MDPEPALAQEVAVVQEVAVKPMAPEQAPVLEVEKAL